MRRSSLQQLAGIVLMLAAVIGNKAMALEIQQAQLANGMKVVVVPDHRSPVVTHSVWYKVGAVDEPDGITGISHMLEHLMFKGTKKFPGGEMEKIVLRNGGQQNAFTSYEMTAYHQTIAVEKLPKLMELESDRMAGLVLSDAVFQPERQVVSEERKWRIESQPTTGFYERLQRARFQSSPFGREIIGSRRDIEAYTLPRILEWYKRHYAPNNATLLLVGDVKLKDILPLAQKYYGPQQPQQVPSRRVAVEPLHQGEVRLVEINKDVRVPVFLRMYRTPSIFEGVAGTSGNPREAVALWALADILGGSDVGRLYQSLVMEKHLADNAHASYDAISGSESDINISVSPRQGVALDKIVAAVDNVVEKVKASGVTPVELRRAQTNLLANETYSLDDADNVMYRLGSWLIAGGTAEGFDDWQQTLKDLTVDDVNAVAKKYLVNGESTLGILVANAKQLGSLKPEAPAIIVPMQAEAAKAARPAPAASANPPKAFH